MTRSAWAMRSPRSRAHSDGDGAGEGETCTGSEEIVIGGTHIPGSPAQASDPFERRGKIDSVMASGGHDTASPSGPVTSGTADGSRVTACPDWSNTRAPSTRFPAAS